MAAVPPTEADTYASLLTGLIGFGSATVITAAAYGIDHAFRWKKLTIKGLGGLALGVLTFTYMSQFLQQGVYQRMDGGYIMYARWVGLIIASLLAYLMWGDFLHVSSVSSRSHDRAKLDGVADAVGRFNKRGAKALVEGDGTYFALPTGARYIGALANALAYFSLLISTFSSGGNEWWWMFPGAFSFGVALWILWTHSNRSDVPAFALMAWVALTWPFNVINWALSPAGRDVWTFHTEQWVYIGVDAWMFVVPAILVCIFYSRPENVLKQQRKGAPIAEPTAMEVMDDARERKRKSHHHHHEAYP
jgi:hypothetical protein